jgi:hypothetical protein
VQGAEEQVEQMLHQLREEIGSNAGLTVKKYRNNNIFLTMKEMLHHTARNLSL